jgi:hypothetical protein
MTISLKQLLKGFIFLLVFAFLIYHLFFYWDFKSSCYITIRPSFTEFSNISIKNGIKFLKSNFPKQYKEFCSNVTSIDPNISCGGYGGGCYMGHLYKPNMIDVSTSYGRYKNAAKVIIHETCHVLQFKDRRPFVEAECYQKDSVIPWNSE